MLLYAIYGFSNTVLKVSKFYLGRLYIYHEIPWNDHEIWKSENCVE